MTDKLTPFEDVDVEVAKIEIPDAAGDLREALAVDPVELHIGDEVYITLRERVKKVRFDPAGKGHAEGALARVHVMETIEAAFIDADQVAAHLRENVDRVKREVERIAGVQRLDDALDDDEQAELDAEHAADMLEAHNMGLHPQSSVAGCAACAQRDADRAADTRARADLS